MRSGRVELRLRVRAAGRAGALLLVDEVLEPRFTARLYVWQLVQWVPMVGDDTCRKLLNAAGIPPWARVGRLTVRQREALVEGLRLHAAARRPKPSPKLVAPPRRKGLPTCPACGEHLVRPAGLCGFCEAERTA